MIAQAWNTAALHRSRRMPPLHRLVGDTERAASSPDEVLQALKMRFGAR